MKSTLVLLASAATAFANSVNHHGKRVFHANVANKARNVEAATLEKRDTFEGQATWYDVTTGPGACGDYMSPSDFVVALNSPQLDAYGGYVNGKPSTCYDSITITYNGVTQVAVIKDECPTCAWGCLDMSEGLFSSFASLDQGVFQMSWWFNDGSTGNTGGDNNNNGGDQPVTTSTTQWQYVAPTTTQPAWTPDPTTSTTPVYVPPTTTDTPTTTYQPPPTSSDTPTTSSTSTSPNNVPAMNVAVVQLAQLINAAIPH